MRERPLAAVLTYFANVEQGRYGTMILTNRIFFKKALFAFMCFIFSFVAMGEIIMRYYLFPMMHLRKKSNLPVKG